MLFTLVFFCALARIELLIEVLPDLEKNKTEFNRHKIVYGAIVTNKLLHCIVVFIGYIGSQTSTHPQIVKVTYAIFIVQELIFFLTYAFQIKILYDFSGVKLSSLSVEDLVLEKDVSLIVYL